MGNVSFVEYPLVLDDKAQALVKAFTLYLSMDVHRPLGQSQGAAYQEFSQTLLAVLTYDGDPLKLGTVLGHSDSKCSHCIVTEEQQQVGTQAILAIEIDGFADSLFFYEDRTAYLLT